MTETGTVDRETKEIETNTNEVCRAETEIGIEKRQKLN